MGLGLVALTRRPSGPEAHAAQAEFGACTPTSNAATHACRLPNGQPLHRYQLPFAVKEARQIILAHAAGAAPGQERQRRRATGRCALRGMLFSPRAWVMAESTLAASAVVTPPLQSAAGDPQRGVQAVPRRPARREQPGLRRARLRLRPPQPGPRRQPAGHSAANAEPEAGDERHLPRHEPHGSRVPRRVRWPPAASPGVCTPSATNECGGEELWAFVPFDQLSKLGERVKPQVRNPHTYVVATPIRVTDIFVPGTSARRRRHVSGTGVWRTVILFGRGIGGKYLTAIDVTAPGRFNEAVARDRAAHRHVEPGQPRHAVGRPDRHPDYNNTTLTAPRTSPPTPAWARRGRFRRSPS